MPNPTKHAPRRVNGGSMKRTALFVLLLLATFSWTAANPDAYSINIHVSSCHWVMAPSLTGPQAVKELNAITKGKKYELAAPAITANLQAGVTLLAPGDYKAKLVQD